MIIKPSKDEMYNLVDSFVNTPYDPETGFLDMKDGAGLAGFLDSHFSRDEGYMKLDCCTYTFKAYNECLDTPIDQCIATKIYKGVGCGYPHEESRKEDSMRLCASEGKKYPFSCWFGMSLYNNVYGSLLHVISCYSIITHISRP